MNLDSRHAEKPEKPAVFDTLRLQNAFASLRVLSHDFSPKNSSAPAQDGSKTVVARRLGDAPPMLDMTKGGATTLDWRPRNGALRRACVPVPGPRGRNSGTSLGQPCWRRPQRRISIRLPFRPPTKSSVSARLSLRFDRKLHCTVEGQTPSRSCPP